MKSEHCGRAPGAGFISRKGTGPSPVDEAIPAGGEERLDPGSHPAIPTWPLMNDATGCPP